MEDNDFISFWENELWKMRCVLCWMSGIVTQKCYCMAVKLLFLFPATLDRLRMSSQVFSNKFIAVCLLTKILACTICRNTWFYRTKLKFSSFLSDNKKMKSFIHSDILVQVTDTLESQFWELCFFSWHSTKNPKNVKHQHYSKVWQCHKCDLTVL